MRPGPKMGEDEHDFGHGSVFDADTRYSETSDLDELLSQAAFEQAQSPVRANCLSKLDPNFRYEIIHRLPSGLDRFTRPFGD